MVTTVHGNHVKIFPDQLLLSDNLMTIEMLAEVCKDHHAELASTLIHIFCRYDRVIPILAHCLTKAVEAEGVPHARHVMSCDTTVCTSCDVMWHHCMHFMWYHVTPLLLLYERHVMSCDTTIATIWTSCDVMWHHYCYCMHFMWCHVTPLLLTVTSLLQCCWRTYFLNWLIINFLHCYGDASSSCIAFVTLNCSCVVTLPKMCVYLGARFSYITVCT